MTEWDLQGRKVLEGKVYKYLGILFHQSLSGKAHAVDLNGRVRRRECIWTTLFKRKNWHNFHGNFLEIRAGAGAQFAFFVLGSHLGHRLALRTFFFLPGLVHR